MSKDEKSNETGSEENPHTDEHGNCLELYNDPHDKDIVCAYISCNELGLDPAIRRSAAYFQINMAWKPNAIIHSLKHIVSNAQVIIEVMQEEIEKAGEIAFNPIRKEYK